MGEDLWDVVDGGFVVWIVVRSLGGGVVRVIVGIRICRVFVF